MRLARRRRVARRRESWALRLSRVGEHPGAIDAASEAVALWRPVAEQYPTAMARALAVRAMCLHVRGRTAEAARDAAECIAYRDRAVGVADANDLAGAALLLDRAGRGDEAVGLAEQLLTDARSRPRPGSFMPMLAYGELMLRHGRPAEAVDALREAHAAAGEWSSARVRASAKLFEALAGAGRAEELEEHARRDLWLIQSKAWGSVPGRRLYIHVLELLDRHHVGSGRRAPFAATLARQRRKLLRQQRRWWVLLAALLVLRGRSREVPNWPRATADPAREAVLGRATPAQAEADIERYRESGDARALSTAWGALALARWQAGGQRSAALEAQRTALAQARQWAAEDPDEARLALVVHLRRFADFAETIGLRTDAQLARAEAEDLGRADR